MAIVVHHLDCGRMNPVGGSLMYGSGAHHRHLVCHVLLLELADRLVLVDTGFGLADIADPTRRLGGTFVNMVRPRLDPASAAVSQIESLGFSTNDVRDVIVTHMDVDHVGGLSDFPHARVHVAATELARAIARPSFHDRMRYRDVQWSHGPDWRRYDAAGEPWFGFPAVHDLDGLPPEILAIPLVGHSMGHSGIAIDTGGPGGDRWLLHCGDAYFHRGEVDRRQPRCPAMLRGFQWWVGADNEVRMANQARLRRLFEDPAADVHLFCAHDPEELDRCTT